MFGCRTRHRLPRANQFVDLPCIESSRNQWHQILSTVHRSPRKSKTLGRRCDVVGTQPHAATGRRQEMSCQPAWTHPCNRRRLGKLRGVEQWQWSQQIRLVGEELRDGMGQSFVCRAAPRRFDGVQCVIGPPPQMIGEQPSLGLDVPSTFVWAFTLPCRCFQPDQKRVRTKFQTQMIRPGHAPASGSMLVESDVVEMIGDTGRHDSPALRGVGAKHTLVRRDGSQKYPLVFHRRGGETQCLKLGHLGNQCCGLRAGLAQEQCTSQCGQCSATFGALGEVDGRPRERTLTTAPNRYAL